MKALEQLIKEHTVSLDVSKFHCELFHRQVKWYRESFTVLGESDGELATAVVDCVVNCIKDWHEKHPRAWEVNADIPESRNAWNALLKTLGRFHAHKLRHVELEYYDNDNRIRRAPIGSDEGLLLETFAVSSGDLPACLLKINAYIATSDFDTTDQHSLASYAMAFKGMEDAAVSSTSLPPLHHQSAQH